MRGMTVRPSANTISQRCRKLSTSQFIVASVIESHAAQTCSSSVAPSIRCLSLLRMAHNISIGLSQGQLLTGAYFDIQCRANAIQPGTAV